MYEAFENEPTERPHVVFDPEFYTEYAEDIIHSMLVQERYRSRNRGGSPQLAVRPLLLDLIKRVAMAKGYMRNSVHLAIYLIDIFMDNHDIPTEMINLVGIVALLLAVKMEESDVQVPRYSQITTKLVELSQNYTVDQFCQYEIVLLNFFGWNLNIPTAPCFLDFYVENAIIPEDFDKLDPATGMCKSFAQLKRQTAEIAYELLELSLEHIDLLDELPSHLAAASISAARYFFELPLWTETLTVVTGFSVTNIHWLIFHLISLRKQDDTVEILVTPDSGYKSDTDTRDSLLAVGPLVKKTKCSKLLNSSQSI